MSTLQLLIPKCLLVLALAWTCTSSVDPERLSKVPRAHLCTACLLVQHTPCLQVLEAVGSSTRFTTRAVHRLGSLGYVGVAPRLRGFLTKLITGSCTAALPPSVQRCKGYGLIMLAMTDLAPHCPSYCQLDRSILSATHLALSSHPSPLLSPLTSHSI